jgi:branched-chain amino acid transport system substrate-binding protein
MSDRFARIIFTLGLLGVASPAAWAATLGPVTDDLGVVEAPKGAPIQIGGYWVLSGSDTADGEDQKRGVEVAIKDVGGQLDGHPIKLIAEDSLCSAEGGQTAATKLAANPNTVIVIGPSCSSEATPGAPILWAAGITSIGTSATAPALTAATRKPSYDGFVRTIYSDIDQGKADAKYFYEALKARKVVTVHDGSPYAQQLTVEMAKNFKALGGEILSQEAIQPTDVDLHPLLTRIAAEKPDAIYFPIFVAGAAQILRQAKEIPGLENVALIGGSSLMSPDLIEAAGKAIIGFRITYPDITTSAMGKDYPKLVEEYKAMFGEGPIGGAHSNAYDAAMLAFKAIEKVAKTDADGNLYIGRKALRDAVYSTEFEGVTGPIACDAHGECSTFKPAVFQFVDADPKSYKIGVNPKKIWP